MNNGLNRLGFMQGRLSPVLHNKIQAFPWENWKEEFRIASEIQLSLMEWTLDSYRFDENPLFGRQSEIFSLKKDYSIEILSLTNDEFMESPPWICGEEKAIQRLSQIIKSMGDLEIEILVLPLVDNSSLSDSIELERCVGVVCREIEGLLLENNVRVAFELDLEASSIMRFLDPLDERAFGVNYDIGNSAALGFSPEIEIQNYGERIFNVHVKDRKYRGSTVPLGEGSADFELVFSELAACRYSGNFIFQTARAPDGRHAEVLTGYKEFLEPLMSRFRE